MAWWIAIALYAATTILSYIFRPKPEGPAELDEFDFPTADNQRPIPVIFGTVLLRSPNVLWYGDLRTQEVTKNAGGVAGFFGARVFVGYKYFIGLHLGLCHGVIDALRSIRFEDKSASYTTSTPSSDYLRVDVDSPNLFSGEDQGGGVVGTFNLYYGSGTQAVNDYLQAKITADLPGYHFVSHAVLRHGYIGMSPRIPALAFELSRYPNTLGLTGGKHIIATYDANPAAILYELLIDPVWGAGISSGLLDLSSFQAAGDALHAEGLGMSIEWGSEQDAWQRVEEVLRHVDGSLYTDLTTGLLRLVLARLDYNPATLDTYDETQISAVQFARPSWSELANVVRVNFNSRADGYTERIAQQQQLAAVQIQDGHRVIETIEFRGLTTAAAANLVAARALKALSYPLAKLRLTMNRHGYELRPASVFKLDWPPLGISGMVLRVIQPEPGRLEDGEISLECVEDVFSIAATAFTAPAPSSWVDPVTSPVAPDATAYLEAPYHLLGSADRHILAMAVRAAGIYLGYEIWSDRTGGTTYVRTHIATRFTPSGLLTAAYVKSTSSTDATGFTVDGGRDLEELLTIQQDEFERGQNLLLIDSEIMAFKTVVDNGNGTWTIQNVMRGVLDTVAADHADNARVYFLMPNGAAIVDPEAPYGADGSVRVKLLPFTSRGILALSAATGTLVTTASRAQLPYPPGNVKINGAMWPGTQQVGWDVVVTWAHRHRVTQEADQRVVAQDAGNYVSTPEGNYTIEVRVGGVLERTVTAITGTTWTWTGAMQSSDGAGAGSQVTIRVIPKNGSLAGTYQERAFDMEI